MNEAMIRMMELTQQGFCCSQILITLGLDAQGKTNPDLVRAMGGLGGGIGYSGKNCGALTGGACLLSMIVGRGSLEERELPSGREMIYDLVQWFDDEYGTRYGGVDCYSILENDLTNRISRCPQIVLEVYEKVTNILEKNRLSLAGRTEEE
jgi:C_GCAxxG_C_C family probable redox protein